MSRRVGICGLFACAMAAVAIAPSAAAAAQWDWAVNGSPVPAGKKVAVDLAATTPLMLEVPALELTVKCEEWVGKGHLEGGMTGMGTIKSPGQMCEFRKDHLEPALCRLKLVEGELSVREADAGPPNEIAVFVKEIQLKGHFSGGKKQETLTGEGPVFTEGPLGATNVFVFGAGKEASNLTIGGAPATLGGEVRFSVKKDPASVIGYAQLP